MKHLSIEDILAGTGGELIARGSDDHVSGISIDSRTCSGGDLFVCIVGPNNDGHRYIDQVLDAGAGAVLISDSDSVEDIGRNTRCSFILVEDTVRAMQDLASFYLRENSIRVIGVTGSVGKTSTSDMVMAACSVRYRTGKTLKNYNNDIGMPVSILSFDEDTEIGVLEMGMDHAGEIELLVNIAKPQIGLITNIGVSHIENLGSRENIFKAKMEITSAFDEECTLIVNGDDEYLGRLLDRPNDDIGYKVIGAGSNGKNQHIIYDIEDGGDKGVDFTLEHEEKVHRIHLPVPGRHNACNASLAIAAACVLGIPVDDAASGLAELRLTGKRLDIRGAGGVKVIDDTYNASPASMRAAIDVLMSTGGIRKVAILGDMFELGESSDRFHGEVGEYAAGSGMDMLIAVGSNAKHYAAGAAGSMDEASVIYYEDKKALMNDIDGIIRPGDVVLVKGSNGMKMDSIAEHILASGADRDHI